MRLLIVESPAKSKTISKYLDNKYKVIASIGHIRDLPKNNKKAIDIDGGFIPHYEISKGKEFVVNEIKTLSKKADEVLLATDPDREGEAIAWHIKEAVGLKNPKRVVFYEITESAVKEAINNPREIDLNLKEAQEARRVLDRLFGYELSGLIWKKVRYGLSAGRVQSPALRILVEKERKIRAFKSHKFWIISADIENKNKEKFTVICEKEPTDKKETDQIVSIGKKESWVVKDVVETEIKRTPRPPFITSSLQQAASSRLGMSPSNTMRVAQKLYEAGHITYMRTDSVVLSSVAVAQIKNIIEKKFGAELFTSRVFTKKSKNAQEAHEAIRPTKMEIESMGGNEQEKKLYELIWQRTIASQMKDAKISKTKIFIRVGDGKIPDFSIIGARIIYPGWFLADPRARSEESELPKVLVGEILKLLEIKTEEKETQPPSRYSEAGLVKELEKRGIGRPSTYASIIRTIVERGYVENINKSLKPTDTGEVVSEFLEKNFANYISDSFTAEMENTLDEIADGKKTYLKTLKDFYKPFHKEILTKESIEKLTTLGDVPEEYKCPICESCMVIKLGKSGKFMSCKKFPNCVGARTIEGNMIEGPKETGEICPKCKTGKLVERTGKYGKFISCSGYPKCKYIKKDAETAKLNSTGVKCPACKEGEMIEKKGKYGIFYSCLNYPKCKHAIKAKPTGNICQHIREDKNNKICEALMMEGTKTIPSRCSDKTCPNHNPHKLNKIK